jgi:simple sugar transport system substrate-binding protein
VNERSGPGDAAWNRALNRRTLLRGGALAAVGFGLAACGATTTSPAVTAAASQAGSSGTKRTIVWVSHSVAEWNLEVDVGFRDFADAAGWTYQKLGVTGGTYSVQDNVNAINVAVQKKPDAIISTMINPAVEAPLVAAQQAGILVVLNNAVLSDVAAKHNWVYIGADSYYEGQLCGTTIGNQLVANGRKSGVIVFGNLEPGDPDIGNRKSGTVAGVDSVNKAAGSTFEVQEFADQAHTAAQSIPLYQAQIQRLGDNLAAFVGGGQPSVENAWQAEQKAGVAPGKIPVGGIDVSPVILDGIDKGYVLLSVDQQLYNQGYMSAATVWSALERLTQPCAVNTGTAIANKDSVAAYRKHLDVVTARAKALGIS